MAHATIYILDYHHRISASLFGRQTHEQSAGAPGLMLPAPVTGLPDNVPVLSEIYDTERVRGIVTGAKRDGQTCRRRRLRSLLLAKFPLTRPMCRRCHALEASYYLKLISSRSPMPRAGFLIDWFCHSASRLFLDYGAI